MFGAIIKEGVVESVIVIDDNTPSSFYDIKFDVIGTLSIGDKVLEGSIIERDGVTLSIQDSENERRAIDARLKRDVLLQENVDAILSNSFRFDSLSDEKKTALLEYRQALLDITKQDGFPSDINWPEEVEV